MSIETSCFDFHPISLEDQEWIREKMAEEHLFSCELCFANNYIWRNVYTVYVCEVMGCGIIRYEEAGEDKYSFPFGNGDKKKILQLLNDYCAKKGKTLCLYPVEEEACRQLKEWFPGQFLITSFRGDYDYIYTTEKLSTLKGKKLHGKRNHIARFMDEPDWNYEPLTKDNMDECRHMSKNWILSRQEKWNDEMEEEMEVLGEALEHMEELGLVGGVLRRKGEVVAFTVGEPLNDETFVVHFEKAIPDIQGAYPMINQQFVLHECQNYIYVNREEDTGDLGLRKAKLSYYPDILLKKYNASGSHVVYATEKDREAIRAIWKECFGDEDAYIDLYFEQRVTDDNMLVIHMDGRPVSMASFLPVTVTIGGEPHAARYVYAVATLPAYRTRGYATEILRFAMDHFDEPLILQPADEDLEQYYGSLGFVKAFGRNRCIEGEQSEVQEEIPVDIAGRAEEKQEAAKIQAAEMIGDITVSDDLTKKTGLEVQKEMRWVMESVTAEEYKQLRDVKFNEEGYMEWNLEAIRYAIAENEFCGGKTVKLVLTEKQGNDDSDVAIHEQETEACAAAVMYRVEGETLYIMETTLCRCELQTVLPMLLRETHTKQVEYPHIGGMILCTGSMADHLTKWNENTGYLGLTLG